MCLIICDTLHKTKSDVRKSAQKPKIANKDIKVKKVFNFSFANGILYSPYHKAKYQQNSLNIIDEFTYDSPTSAEAFNYFGIKQKPKKGYFLSIHKGFHSLKNTNDTDVLIQKIIDNSKNKLYRDHVQVIINCIIPKGSRYFENKIEIVSDQLFIPAWIIGEEKPGVYNTSKDWKMSWEN